MPLENLIALNDELARESGRAFDSGFQMIQQFKTNSLNMAMKKMQMDQAARSFPFELDQLERAGKVQELNMQILQHRKDIELDELAGAKDLAATIAQYPANNPLRAQKIWEVGARHPSLQATPEFKLAIDEGEKANMASIRIAEEQRKTEALKNQLAINIDRLSLAQERIDAMKEKGGADQHSRDWERKKQADADLQRKVQIFESLPDSDPGKAKAQVDVQDAEQEAQHWDAVTKGSQTTVSATSPSGEQFNVAIGAAGAGPTGTASAVGGASRGLGTKVALQVAKYENAMTLVNELDHRLDAGDVGLRGNIREFWGKLAGQIDPSQVSPKTMEMRNKIIQLRESVAREIPEGGRETRQQREDVLDSLPSNGIFESEANARVALKSARDLLAQRAQNYGAEMGRRPLVSMTAQQILADYQAEKTALDARVKAGLLTPHQSLDILRKIYVQHQDAVERFHGNKPEWQNK